MIGLFERNRRGLRITRPLERRLQLLNGWCQPYRRVADIGAGAGRLSRALADQGIIVMATEASQNGLAMLIGQREREEISVRSGDGLRPLINEPPFDAIVVAGMGSEIVLHILGQRHLLAYQPIFLIQPVQGILTVRKYLQTQQACIQRASLVQERGHIYASWRVLFAADCEPSAKMLGEFHHDPLWSELSRRETQFRQNKLKFPISDEEDQKTRDELQYWSESDGGGHTLPQTPH